MLPLSRFFFCSFLLMHGSVVAACGAHRVVWGEVDAALRKNANPVVVVFCADWAPYCPAYISTVDAAACKRPNTAFFLLDIDKEAKRAKELSLTGLPTTLIFHGYKEAKRALGASTAEKLESILIDNGVYAEQTR